MLPTITLIVAAAVAPTPDRHAAIWSGYLDDATLTERLVGLADAHAQTCRLVRIGESLEGRPIHALVIGRGEPGPALLLSAGLDGLHLVGSEVAVRIAEALVADPTRLPDGVRLIVVPRVNPDAAARTLMPGTAPQIRNLRAVDDDRDGSLDEDPPNDLDGDGVVTMMRIARPALPEGATHVADHDDPRLMRPADPNRGETPTHRLVIEGTDDDGDGMVGEDPPGGVDLNRNWPHRWPEHGDGAGTHPVSEPESLALAQFVLTRREIAAALTYGRHDNLIHVPDGRGRDVNPRVPLDLEPGDVALHAELATLFRERTGESRAPKEEIAGSFHAWLYAQRGRVSLATVVWGRPDAPAADDATDPTEAPASDDATTPSAPDASPETVATDAPTPRGRRGAAAARPRGDDGSLEEERAWLAYSDRVRDGGGFVDWTAFDHDQFGPVEIGGWIPGFRENPPASELDALAERHLPFVVELLDRLPRIEVGRIEVERLADALWVVRVEVRNRARDGGGLPFGTAHSANSGAGDSVVLRMEVDRGRLLGGQRVERIAHLESGAVRLLEWTVVAPEGTTLPLVLRRPGLDEMTITIECTPTGDDR